MFIIKNIWKKFTNQETLKKPSLTLRVKLSTFMTMVVLKNYSIMGQKDLSFRMDIK